MFRVEQSRNGLPCLQASDAKGREVLISMLNRSYMTDPVYQARAKAGAFLQANTETFVLVEFWGRNYLDFVELANKLLRGEEV